MSAIPIHRYGAEATSVFDLPGRNEVPLTAALGRWPAATRSLGGRRG